MVNKYMVEKFNKIKIINNDMEFNDIDFIATAISGWHLNIIYSFLLSLNKKLKGIIIINSNRISNNMIINIQEININYVNADSIKYKNLISYFNFLFNKKNEIKGKEFWVLSPCGYNLKLFAKFENYYKSRNVNLIKYDEGLGSYVTELEFTSDLIANKNIKNIKVQLIKTKIKLIIKNILIQRLIKNEYSMAEFLLFTKENDKLIENTKNTQHIRSFYYNIIHCFKLNVISNQIFILKDYNEGLMDPHDLNIFYLDIINSLLKLNKTIYIKVHPEENIETFKEIAESYSNVVVLPNTLDAELLYILLNPVITIGGISSCSFTIPVIYNKKIYNYSNLYYNYKIKPYLHNEILLRKRYFSHDNRIIFIDSLDAIVNSNGTTY